MIGIPRIHWSVVLVVKIINIPSQLKNNIKNIHSNIKAKRRLRQLRKYHKQLIVHDMLHMTNTN